MSNKLNNEQKEFIRVFMLSEMGLTVKRKKVKNHFTFFKMPQISLGANSLLQNAAYKFCA